MEERSPKHCCYGMVIIIPYYVCVSVAQITNLQSTCAVLFCHQWLASLYHIFPHYLINVTVFRKKLWNIKRVLIFSALLSEIFLVLKTFNEVLSYMYIGPHIKYPLFSSDFYLIWISRHF